MNATWDETLLGDAFRELSVLDLDFSLEVTGFDIPEIDLLIEGVTPQPDNRYLVGSVFLRQFTDDEFRALVG